MSVRVREKVLSDGSISLYLDIYNNKKRSYEFLGIRYNPKNKEQKKESVLLAEKIRAMRELELANGKYNQVATHVRKFDFLKYFEKKVEGKKHIYQVVLNVMERFAGGEPLLMKDITSDKMKELSAWLSKTYRNNTPVTYWICISHIVRQAVNEGLIDDPLRGVKRPKNVEVIRSYLTIDEVEKLSRVGWPSGEELKRAFLFSCFTGLRFSDITKLRWEMITKDGIEYRQKKTGSVEYLPLSETARKLLGKEHEEGVVFRMPCSSVANKRLKKVAEKAGIKKHISFHTARHTFATMSLTVGVDLYTVSKLLGHKDISTTQIYAKIVDQKKNDAINKLPRIEI